MRIVAVAVLTCAVVLGCESDGLIWMPPLRNADPLFRIIVRGKAGFINKQGHIVIPPKLDVGSNWGQAFYDGLLSLGDSSGGPFLNIHGKKLLDNGFYWIWDFSEGLAPALEEDSSEWGYIDKAGKFVIPPRFPTYPEGLVHNFAEGLALVETDGKVGYIDRSGEFVIQQRFVAGTSFKNGFARVAVDGPCQYFDYEHFDPCSRMPARGAPATGGVSRAARSRARLCKWRFIDKTGKQIIEKEFEAALAFHEGLAAVKVGDKWGFIDLRGEFAIPPSFDEVHSFSDGLALVSNRSMSGFVDKTGKLVISVDFYKAEPFADGLGLMGDPDDGYIYVNQSGKQVIAQRYVLASSFFHGLAHVKLDGSSVPNSKGIYAYIDRTGKRVFTYKIED